MLKLPPHRKIGDVTVYQDDAVWHRFYLVPSRPSIRRDKNGRPVFLFATYALSQDAREEDPTLPGGGGYMNFDTQFAVEESQVESIKAELQEWIDEEHRSGRAPSSGGPPTVEIADVLLSGGTVTMLAPQSQALVNGRFAEAPASLTSGSTAVFNIDLTPAGASFMHDLLVVPDGSGNVDLTPIQVIYALSMWVRMPPVTITVTGQSERIHKTLLSISEDNRDNPCTPSEIETYRERGTSSSTLRETGHVHVQVDAGDARLPEEVVQALQGYALSLFDTMVKERFLVPAESDDDPFGFDSDDPGIEGHDAGWVAILYEHNDYGGEAVEVTESVADLGSINNKVSSLKVRSGARITLYDRKGHSGSIRQFSSSTRSVGPAWNDRAESVRIWLPPTTRYKVRRSVNHATMDLRIQVERSSVVEWPVGGQATLETFFAGMPASEIKRHVVAITADDFQRLGVEVRAFADFDGPIQAVEVETDYTVTDDRDETHRATDTFTFLAGETAVQKFDPPVISGRREFRFRYRVIYDDGSATEPSEWETRSGRALNVSVQDPGRIDIELSAATLNFEIVRGATVELRYEDAEAGIEPIAHTFELNQSVATHKWERSFNRRLRGDITAKVKYFLQDDKVLEADPVAFPATQTLLVVPPPQVDILDVSFVPSGDWSDVAQAVVSAKYEAADGHVYDKVFRFTAIDQFAQWQVLLQDPTRRSFSYRTTVTYKTGAAPTETDWVTKTGDQAVLIEAFGPPKLRVHVLSNLVDFERTPAVTVSFIYGDTRKTVSFTEPKADVFEAPQLPDGRTEYAYEITYHTTDGDPVTAGPQRTSDTELFVPRAKLPTIGKLEVHVRAFAVDWDATPVVDVVLTWNDGELQERKHIVLDKTKTSDVWSLDVGDRTQRTYGYAITYNLPDGTLADGASGSTSAPMISVTRYQP
jgi:hypothetical protein